MSDEVRLPIQTVYYRGKEIVRVNRAGKSLKAMQLCLGYMRRNTYEANVAEVHDLDTGELYGVMKRKMNGQVVPIFELPLQEGE